MKALLTQLMRFGVVGGFGFVLDVTIFNPRLDPDGTIAGRLAECLRRGLSTRAGHVRST